MKALNRFFSARVFFIFASIFFLSQNVMAGNKKYEEKGLAGDSGLKVRIENIGAYTLDEVTVTVLTDNNGCQMGQSVTRGINIKGKTLFPNYGVWHLKSDCQYAVTGKAVLGRGSIKRTTFTPVDNCSITFNGPVFSPYSRTYDCSP